LPLAIVAAYVLGAFGLPGAWRALPAVAKYPVALGAVGLVPLVVGVFRHRARAGGSFASGWRAGIRLAREDGWYSERLAWFLAVVALTPLFFWAFASWKTFLGPFRWDVRLASWDAALHGTYPHRWLPHSPKAIQAMSLWYWGWIGLLYSVMLWQSWTGTRETRARFWLAFVLTWIGLGTVVAHLVASAGPVFFSEVTGSPGPYGGLMADIARADRRFGLDLLTAHHSLWEATVRHQVLVGGGISAFPSLHIAIPVLAACAAWSVSRWLTAGFLIYALLTLICAVGLGWHYAVDGYASLLLVPLIWWVSGRLTDHHGGTRALPRGPGDADSSRRHDVGAGQHR
jgi:hypothetical protein